MLKLWQDLEEEKSLKQRIDFSKEFETMNGFPTIPVQKSFETMARFRRGKTLKQRMDFQQSQCKKALKLWLGL